MEKVFVFSDGGIIGSNPSPIGGTWAYCIMTPEDRMIGSGSGIILTAGAKQAAGDCDMVQQDNLPFDSVENNLMEMIAAVEGLKRTKAGDSIIWGCDNNNTIQRITGSWAWNGIPHDIKELAQEIARTRTIVPILLSGHPTKAQLLSGIGKRGTPVSKWNQWCDSECNRVKKLYVENV